MELVYFTVLFAIGATGDIDATVPNVRISKSPLVEWYVAVSEGGAPPWFEVTCPWTVPVSVSVFKSSLIVHVLDSEPDRVGIAKVVTRGPVLDVSRPVFIRTVGERLSNVAEGRPRDRTYGWILLGLSRKGSHCG